jgi:hypothetical protein
MANENSEPKDAPAPPSNPAPAPKERLPSKPDPQLVFRREANDTSTPRIVATDGDE